ncbi:MAG: type II secretion system protein M [Candidatus Aureabacteria bacterium]|nr:type II secretion system protein M [Candidatus Auribacterota bacterium]HOE26262.1 type II secretion system protein GspM [bacterium]HQM52628.1 type II secretion system protein GspM [bacterium]
MKKLAPREKKLIAAAAVAIVVFLLIQFAVSPLLGYYDRIRTETPAMRRDVRLARRSAARFGALDREIGDIRARLAQRTNEFNPYVSLSEIAREEGLSTEAIQMEKKPLEGGFQEETARVTLKRVPLARLVGYLYRIENSPDLMTVKVLSIGVDSADSHLLDVALDASTITKAERRDGADDRDAPAKKPRSRRR